MCLCFLDLDVDPLESVWECLDFFYFRLEDDLSLSCLSPELDLEDLSLELEINDLSLDLDLEDPFLDLDEQNDLDLT